MKPIETNKLLNFADFKSHSDTYIETGSCYGGSITKALSAGYTKIKSVEVFEKFYNHCVELFASNQNIELYLGKSADKLPEMFSDVTKPAVIFLDAHPAGPNTGGHDDLMEKGNKSEFAQDNILTKELEIILNHSVEHLIIIDDQNGFNPENAEYMKMLLDANPNYEFFFYDEHLSSGARYYKNKSLVCIPKI